MRRRRVCWPDLTRRERAKAPRVVVTVLIPPGSGAPLLRESAPGEVRLELCPYPLHDENSLPNFHVASCSRCHKWIRYEAWCARNRKARKALDQLLRGDVDQVVREL